MKTIADLRRARTTAGAAYAAAATAYLDAWVELHACDLTLKNKSGDHFSGFVGEPTLLKHGEFLRELPAGSLGDRSRARLKELLVECSD